MPRGRKRRTEEQCASDFWLRVDRLGPDECWPWIGSLNPGGYGKFCKWRKTEAAHREAYRLQIGEIPYGLKVCHHCDNRRCCNGSHLFLGTNADNVHDCVRKGRNAKGQSQGAAKLSDSEVFEIRQEYSRARGSRIRAKRNSNSGIVAIAEKHKVSKSLVYVIVNGLAWKHVAMPNTATL